MRTYNHLFYKKVPFTEYSLDKMIDAWEGNTVENSNDRTPEFLSDKGDQEVVIYNQADNSHEKILMALTKRQVEVLKVLEKYSGDRTKTARELKVSKIGLHRIIARIRKRLFEYGYKK